MSVYKRPGSRFYTMNFTYMGKNINKSSGEVTEAAAEAKIEELKLIMRQEALQPKLASISLSSAVRKVYDERWSLQGSGDTSYRQAMKFVEILGDIPVTAVDTAKVRTAAATLRKTGITETTVNRYLASLRTTMNYTKHEVDLKMPHFALTKEVSGRMKFFTFAEEDAIIKHFTEMDREDIADCCALLLDTGFRVSECLGINKKTTAGKMISTVDFKNNIVTSLINKGKKIRSVPLTTRSRKILLRRAADGKAPFPFDIYQIEYRFKCMRRSLGMAEDCILHAMRHTCASRLVQAGQPLQVVKEWLGHSSITTTEIYAHLAPNALRNALGALERPAGMEATPVAVGTKPPRKSRTILPKRMEHLAFEV